MSAPPRARAMRLSAIATVFLLLAGSVQLMLGSAPASATIATDAQAAAQLADSAGYRSGVAVLNLTTGEYDSGGSDTGSFASESVAKILIATELLATGQLTGSTETTAYQMITESDDDDADALYGLAGGDNVIDLVAARYNIPFLGTPPSQPGWWGNTEISAKGMVYLYAAIAKDSVVGPWLENAMAHATEYGADGTYQFFGIPSATTGAAIKQGWGDDGDDSPNAVFNSTGYVDGGKYAVAILTDGSPSTYGSTISAMVTAQARRLMPNGQLDDPVEHNPSISGVTATSVGNAVTVTGSATDPDTTGAVSITVFQGSSQVAAGSTAAGQPAFSLMFKAPDGAHAYTVTAGNVGEGTANASATAAAITVDGDPGGAVTTVTGGRGRITVTGVESDPDLSTGEVPGLTVSVDGQSSVTASASGTTSSAGAHAFDVVVPAAAGNHQVIVTFASSGDGKAVTQGTWPVRVAETIAQRDAHRWHLAELGVAAAVGVSLLAGIGWRVRRRRGRRTTSAENDSSWRSRFVTSGRRS